MNKSNLPIWPRYQALLMIGAALLANAIPVVHASIWDPVALVNTESINEIDEGDGTTDVTLQFGDTLLETINFDRTNSRFSISDDIYAEGDVEAQGTLSGSDLTLSGMRSCATLSTSSSGVTTCVQSARGQFQENSGGIDVNGAGIAVPWDAEIFKDTGITHSNTVNPSRVTLDEIGQYRISYNVSSEAQTNARKNVRCRVRMNGVTFLDYTNSYSYARDLTDEWATNTAVAMIETTAANEYYEVFCNGEGTGGGSFTVVGESWTLVEKLGGIPTPAPSNTTLDIAYDNDAGERTVAVDAGDVSFDLTGAHNFIVDLQGTGNVGVNTESPSEDFEVVGTVSGSSTVTLSQYNNCLNLQTDANGVVTCVTGTSANDALYVNTSGDTMTGDLIIANGASLSTSGAISTEDNLTINADNGAVDAVLTFGNSIQQETLRYSNGDALFDFSAALSVSGSVTARGTVSGASLVVSDLNNCNSLTTDANGAVQCAKGGFVSVSTDENSTASAAPTDLFEDGSYPGTLDFTTQGSGGIIFTQTNGRFTIANTGAYNITFAPIVEVSATTALDIIISVDGAAVYTHNVSINAAGDPVLQTVSIVRELNAGQYVEMSVDSNTANTVTANDGTVATISAIGGTVVSGGGGGSNPTLDDAYDNDAGERTITVDAGDVSFDLAGANQFIIDRQGTGNVGIGTSNPTVPLTVSGAISGSSLSVGGSVSRGGFFYAYDTVGDTTLGAGVYTTIDNNQIVIQDGNFYAEAAGVVTIQQTGLYRIDAKCGSSKPGGTREFAECAIHVNGAIQNNLTCAMYAREIAGVSGTSCAINGLHSLTNGDTLTLRYNPDTANMDPADNEQSLTLEFVQ